MAGILNLKKKVRRTGAREMAQEFKVFPALPEVQGLGPSPHLRQLTVTCNFSFRGPNTLFWFPWTLGKCGIHSHRHMLIDINKKKCFNQKDTEI